jgi:Tat protein translocase TatB subunit
VFGIGLTEMILIGIVIMLLFSPRELPGMIKSVAKVYGSIRRTAEEFRAQVMEAEELREPIEEIRAAYHGTKQELQSAQDLARRELMRARQEAMKAQQKLSEIAREESRRTQAALKDAGNDAGKEPAPAPAAPAKAAPFAPAAPTEAVAATRPFAADEPAPPAPSAPANDRPDAA